MANEWCLCINVYTTDEEIQMFSYIHQTNTVDALLGCERERTTLRLCTEHKQNRCSACPLLIVPGTGEEKDAAAGWLTAFCVRERKRRPPVSWFSQSTATPAVENRSREIRNPIFVLFTTNYIGIHFFFIGKFLVRLLVTTISVV